MKYAVNNGNIYNFNNFKLIVGDAKHIQLLRILFISSRKELNISKYFNIDVINRNDTIYGIIYNDKYIRIVAEKTVNKLLKLHEVIR